jgi:hypothetical protein
MAIVWIILSILLWVAAIWFLFRNQLFAPALSFLGLLAMSFAANGDVPIVPINSRMLISWLALSLIVTATTAMQPSAVTSQTRGIGYMTIGGFAGMAAGLASYGLASAVSLVYGLMVGGVVIGVFFGYLIFTRTPAGTGVNLRSGYFFRYLLAKGFPVAITLMMPGMAAVIAILINI